MKTIRLLDTINSPADLKKLDKSQLPRLAEEIRKEILETVSTNGGHLSSNLGAVELAIALHYSFDAPRDRIVWDVGHQAYPHKLLTGRLDRFRTIRQYGGISGFLKREESPYDAFGAGHASTSISAALGLSEGLCHKGIKQKVIAVIGDGGMTNGLAFEALNQAGDLEKDLIVVLNHNEMSISGNVGALSHWFSGKLTGSKFQNVRAEVKRVLSSFPTMGPELMKVIRRVVESTKVLLTPGILFEGFNFQYVGPVDGHDTETLLKTFKRVQVMEGPILVHVVTKKGKGYSFAEQDPERFHGLGAFDLKTGRSKKSSSDVPSYTKVFSDTMIELAADYPNLVAVTAAMPSGTGLSEFSRTFPKRFYDVGIAEGHAVTFAAGMAAEGLKPVVAIYSTFLQRSFDQIVHDVALQKLPVVFALDRGGLVGEDGPTHHGILDLAYLRMIPDLVVAAPKDEDELKDILLTGVEYDGPFALRYPRGSAEGAKIKDKPVKIEIGKGELLYKPESKAVATIVAIGSRVYPSVKAAKNLDKDGVGVNVINARFVKPLDEKLIKKHCAKMKYVFTVEDNTAKGGFGSAVLEFLSSELKKLPSFTMIGLPDMFVTHGPQKQLYADYGLDAEGIEQKLRKTIKK